MFLRLRLLQNICIGINCLWEIKTQIDLWVIKLQQMGMQFAANPLLQFVWEIFFSYMWYNGSLVAETEYLMVMCCRSVSTDIIRVYELGTGALAGPGGA